MKIRIPKFEEGTDYRRMAVSESGGVYRFKLLKPVTFTFLEPVVAAGKRLSFRTDGVEWLNISESQMTIIAGYAWNGNSPKRGIRFLGRDLWLGTPDMDPLPPLPHDAIFQYSYLPEMPFSCAQANDLYEQTCIVRKASLASTYRAALDKFSHKFWAKTDARQTCVTT